MTWLLVEDDNDIRNVVAVMMSVWGEKPLSFADGAAAWAWIDSVVNGTFTGELPDLALMDIRMPGYTGDKVAARIRQTPGIKDIPIILMTAFSLSEAEVQVMIEQTGIDHLINKPLPDMEIFRSTLYRIRDERRARLASGKKEPKPAAEPEAKPATTQQPAAQQPAPQPATPQPEAKPAEPAKPAPQPTTSQSTPQPTQPTQPATQQPATPSTGQPAQSATQQPAAKPAEPAKPAPQPATPQPTPQPTAKPTEPVKPARPSENKSK